MNRRLWVLALAPLVITQCGPSQCAPTEPPAPTTVSAPPTSTTEPPATTSTTSTTSTAVPPVEGEIPDQLRGELSMPAELLAAVEPIAFLDAPARTGRQVAPTLDPSRAVTARLGVEGGTIAVTSARGDSLTSRSARRAAGAEDDHGHADRGRRRVRRRATVRPRPRTGGPDAAATRSPRGGPVRRDHQPRRRGGRLGRWLLATRCLDANARIDRPSSR